MALLVDIVTPTGLVAEDIPTDEITAPSVLGELGILPQHTPIIANLKPGVVAFKRDGEHHVYAVHEGFLELDHDKLRVLAQECISGFEVNVGEQQERLADFEAKMKDLDTSSDDYLFLAQHHAFCEAQLKAAELAAAAPRVK